jgi:hypothetical protein
MHYAENEEKAEMSKWDAVRENGTALVRIQVAKIERRRWVVNAREELREQARAEKKRKEMKET